MRHILFVPVRIGFLCLFALYFVKILVQSNWQVAVAAMRPGRHSRPRIIRYPVDTLTPLQRLVLSSAITLTPGTLTVDVSPDGRWVYIHCMFGEDRAAAVASIDHLADRIRRWVFP